MSDTPVDQHDGRGFQPVDGATVGVAALSVAENAEEEEGKLDNLPKRVQLRLGALRKLQEAQAEVEGQFEKERKALELKYEKLYQRFYSQRAEIVTGEKEVEEVTAATFVAEDEDVKGVPGFWLRALTNHSMVADLIHERDLPAFEFLADVRSTSHEDDDGFKLDFEFAENPFFANKVLTKDFDVDTSAADEVMVRDVRGTVIEWKKGKSLSEVTKEVKLRAKRGRGKTRVVTRTEPCYSFFRFFLPTDVALKSLGNVDSDIIKGKLCGDFNIGSTIHETIIPQALLWFTGEAAKLDDSDDDPEEDEDYEDYESDESDDDESPKPRRGKKLPALKGGATSIEQPPECKNQ